MQLFIKEKNLFFWWLKIKQFPWSSVIFFERHQYHHQRSFYPNFEKIRVFSRPYLKTTNAYKEPSESKLKIISSTL